MCILSLMLFHLVFTMHPNDKLNPTQIESILQLKFAREKSTKIAQIQKVKVGFKN